MERIDGAVLGTLQRAQRFIETHEDLLSGVAESGARQRFDEAIASLEQAMVAQATMKRAGAGETARQRVLRNILKLVHMRPITAIAAAELRDATEWNAMQMPPADATSRRLIIVARAMAVAAEVHTATFVEMGLPADFVARLRAAADVLDDCLANRGNLMTQLAGATATIKDRASRGREVLRVLDALIEPRLAPDPSLLMEWKTAKRFSGRTVGLTTTLADTMAIDAPATRETAGAPALAG